jgi:hypothetical protein
VEFFFKEKKKGVEKVFSFEFSFSIVQIELPSELLPTFSNHPVDQTGKSINNLVI